MAIDIDIIERQIVQLLHMLPPERAAELLDFAEFLSARPRSTAPHRLAVIQESFGAWRDRSDLAGDSAALIRAMRDL